MSHNEDWKQRLKSFAKIYKDDMPLYSAIDAESELWSNLWLSGSKDLLLPKAIPETLNVILDKVYPNIYTVLKILVVLSVTTCSCERSISTLRRVKTYLRNTMQQVCKI